MWPHRPEYLRNGDLDGGVTDDPDQWVKKSFITLDQSSSVYQLGRTTGNPDANRSTRTRALAFGGSRSLGSVR